MEHGWKWADRWRTFLAQRPCAVPARPRAVSRIAASNTLPAAPTASATATSAAATAARRVGPADLAVASLLVVAGGVLALALPEGSLLRLAVGAPAILLAPGYLALQAAMRPGPAERRPLHLVFALGLSPAIVGLIALATAIVPGGFRPPVIIVAIMAGCLAMAGVAYARRRQVPAQATAPQPATA